MRSKKSKHNLDLMQFVGTLNPWKKGLKIHGGALGKFKRGDTLKILHFDRSDEQGSLLQRVELVTFVEYSPENKNQITVVNESGRLERVDIKNIVLDETYGGASETV